MITSFSRTEQAPLWFTQLPFEIKILKIPSWKKTKKTSLTKKTNLFLDIVSFLSFQVKF